MTGAEQLRSALTAGDFCDETVSAALDALREDEGLTLVQAVLGVAHINQEWWAERNLRVATALLADTSPLRREMNSLFLRYLEPNLYDEIRVYVTRGEGRPSWLRQPERSPSGVWSRAVQVGSVWLIEHTDELELKPEKEEWLQAVLNS